MSASNAITRDIPVYLKQGKCPLPPLSRSKRDVFRVQVVYNESIWKERRGMVEVAGANSCGGDVCGH